MALISDTVSWLSKMIFHAGSTRDGLSKSSAKVEVEVDDGAMHHSKDSIQNFKDRQLGGRDAETNLAKISSSSEEERPPLLREPYATR